MPKVKEVKICKKSSKPKKSARTIVKALLKSRKPKKALLKTRKPAKVTSVAITTCLVRETLISLYSHTAQAARMARVDSHIYSINVAEGAGKAIKSTRIGKLLEAFKKANKTRNVTKEVIADFLYARILNSGRNIAATKRLVEGNFTFEASIIPMIRKTK